MSRSYKHTPYCGDKKHSKNLANKKVRNYLKQGKCISNGSEYKKIYPSYDICDYYSIISWPEYWNGILKAWKHRLNRSRLTEPNKLEFFLKWQKLYLRK